LKKIKSAPARKGTEKLIAQIKRRIEQYVHLKKVEGGEPEKISDNLKCYKRG